MSRKWVIVATRETSAIRFIGDNWNLGRLGNGSFDPLTGSIDNMFDFGRNHRVTAVDGHCF